MGDPLHKTGSIAQREEILKNRFGKQQFQELLKNKITQLNDNIESHRNKNFVGQILNNNAHNSLKYMSKWIEEKNKLANRSCFVHHNDTLNLGY